MANFTVNPFLYLLFHQSQQHARLNIKPGVPVLDRDLNLLGELSSQWIRQSISRYLGNGIMEVSDEAFCIVPGDTSADPNAIYNDFAIKAGSLLLDGWVISNGADLRYSNQTGVATLTTPVGAARTDIVYLDVWLEDVEGTAYDQMVTQFYNDNNINLNDVGLQTAVPQKLRWAVRVDEGSTTLPPTGSGDPLYGHLLLPLASLNRPSGEDGITANLITDLRPTLLLHDRLNILENKALKPAFASSPYPQLERTYATFGEQRRIYGRNLHMDGLSAQLVPTGGGSNLATSIVGVPSVTEALIQMPFSGFTGGETVNVQVTTEFGTATSSTVLTLLGNEGIPSFASSNPVVNPIANAGTIVTLYGTNFNADPSIVFGSTNVQSSDIISIAYDSIVVRVPSSLSSGPTTIRVTTYYGYTETSFTVG